jgi:hypothetical protein
MFFFHFLASLLVNGFVPVCDDPNKKKGAR